MLKKNIGDNSESGIKRIYGIYFAGREYKF